MLKLDFTLSAIHGCECFIPLHLLFLTQLESLFKIKFMLVVIVHMSCSAEPSVMDEENYVAGIDIRL